MVTAAKKHDTFTPVLFYFPERGHRVGPARYGLAGDTMKKASPCLSLDPARIKALHKEVRALYRRAGRALPFRETRDPYAVAVSETMLQQTQVERVVPKYLAWLERFPDWEALAKADTREVLAAWSGLGYNRRALYLQKLARTVVENFGGELPSDPVVLRKLPGLGPYSANAIAIMAYGRRVAAVDTNVRKVLIHLLELPTETPMAEIQRIAELVLPRTGIREWHYALMDYARLALPRAAHRRIPPTSKQSRYEGSNRQIRGEIIRRLTVRKQVSLRAVAEAMGRTEEDVRRAAEGLEKDGLVVLAGKTVRLR